MFLRNFILIFLSGFFFCCTPNYDEAIQRELQGSWVEVSDNDKQKDTIGFLDNTTLKMRTKEMQNGIAYKYEIDGNTLILFNLNSQMNWVEDLRYPFELDNERLIINSLYDTDENSHTIFRKVNN